MFKRKSEKPQAKPEVPPAPIRKEAEKIVARSERIERLSAETAMWRRFAADSQPGRRLYESISFMGMTCVGTLNCTMDEDTAPLWRAFANQMAEERERRLKDMLGV